MTRRQALDEGGAKPHLLASPEPRAPTHREGGGMLLANDKTQGECRMATPNYSYEKRQRELAKKR